MDHAELAGLDNQTLLEVAHHAAAKRRRAEAFEVAVAAQIQARSDDVPTEDSMARQYGAKNPTELLQRVTLGSARDVRRRLRLARNITPRTTLTGQQLPETCPAVAKALAEGALPLDSAAHITDLVKKVEHVAHPKDLADAEKHLVEAASGLQFGMGAAGTLQTLNELTDAEDTAALGSLGDTIVPYDPDEVRVMCKAWQEALDPDGSLPNEGDMRRGRSVRFGKKQDGLVTLYARLLPEVAAGLARLFDAFGNPRVANKTHDDSAPNQTTSETGRKTSDDEKARKAALSALDERTPDQKRHDILATILNVAMRSKETPTLGGAPVTVMVQVTDETLATGRGHAWLHDHNGERSPISVNFARHAACSGVMQRILQDKNGRIIKLGSPERAFNAHQRRAITVRDGGCVIPGCNVPATWCEVHHVHEHSKGGRTHTDNGVLLCWHHHRHLDHHGWKITMEKGVPKVEPPAWLTELWARTHRPPDVTRAV